LTAYNFAYIDENETQVGRISVEKNVDG